MCDDHTIYREIEPFIVSWSPDKTVYIQQAGILVAIYRDEFKSKDISENLSESHLCENLTFENLVSPNWKWRTHNSLRRVSMIFEQAYNCN